MVRTGARFSFACVAFLLIATVAALAQKPVTIFGLTFPNRIAGAQIVPEPHKYDTADLGYSVEYRRPNWEIDVFIYDLGHSSVPDDPQSEPVVGQLARATADIVKAYTKVNTKLTYAILDDKARVRFLCRSFGYTDKRRIRDSYLCVTSAKSKFVKFRLTIDRRAGSESDANAFMSAWTQILWP